MNSHTKKIMAAVVSIGVLAICGFLTLIYSEPTSTIRIISFSAICLILGTLFGKGPFPPFTTARALIRRLLAEPGPEGFKIRIAIGDSPMDVSSLDGPTACTLGPDIVTDLDALFIADPFVVIQDQRAWLFFEALERKDRKGVICAAWSEDGKTWTYHGKILEESFHLSYPQIIKHEGELWMIPESCHDYSVRLYRANNFPDQWTHTKTLLTGYCYCDSTLFQKDNAWWLFSSIGNDHLNLYSSHSLDGPWAPHANNPIINSGPRDSRMAGSVIDVDGKLIRISQDCVEKYGHFLRGYEIKELSKDAYEEKELTNSPILYPSPNSWKTHGCHHLSQENFKGKWLIASDGY